MLLNNVVLLSLLSPLAKFDGKKGIDHAYPGVAPPTADEKDKVSNSFKETVHRKRITTEEKAMVVTAAWGTELIHFLSAPVFFSHQDDMMKRMNSSHFSNRPKAK